MRVLLICGLLMMIVLPLRAQQAVKADLVAEIKAAQQQLKRTQHNIAKKSADLAAQIRKKQQAVLKLRKQATVKRRLIDDQTLALDKLQSRLQHWRNQDSYQKRLLLAVAEENNAPLERLKHMGEDLGAGMAYLLEQFKLQDQQLQPNWQSRQIQLPEGQLVQASTLQLGPVSWFVHQQQAGLLGDENQVTYFFAPAQREAIITLAEEGSGSLTFDPSLGNALQLAKRQESPIEHVQRGGVWVLPILAFGLFALLIALYKGWQLYRLPKMQPLLAERLAMLPSGEDLTAKLTQLKQTLVGAQHKLVDITLANPAGDQRDDKLLAFLLAYRQRLQSSLGAIALTAAVAPLLGLLGTVSGMIETFNMMNLFGSGDPAVVSGGISKALITTELGLVVAIPALVLHALLNRFIRNHNTQLETVAINLGKLQIAAETGEREE